MGHLEKEELSQEWPTAENTKNTVLPEEKKRTDFAFFLLTTKMN